MNTKTKILLPFIIAVSICIGVLAGIFLLNSNMVPYKKVQQQATGSKLDFLLGIINQCYR